jgi:hypothetical protein
VTNFVGNGAVCIKGDHHEATCNLSMGMTDNAQTAIEWTRQQLNAITFDQFGNYMGRR